MLPKNSCLPCCTIIPLYVGVCTCSGPSLFAMSNYGVQRSEATLGLWPRIKWQPGDLYHAPELTVTFCFSPVIYNANLLVQRHTWMHYILSSYPLQNKACMPNRVKQALQNRLVAVTRQLVHCYAWMQQYDTALGASCSHICVVSRWRASNSHDNHSTGP